MIGHDPNYFIWSGLVHRMNKIANARDVGVWIENAGGSLDENGNRVQPNVLHNNYIASHDGYTPALPSHDIGLKISGYSRVNDIGGRLGCNLAVIQCDPTIFVSRRELYTKEGNFIQGAVAGVQLDGVTIRDPAERNRFLNNVISSESGAADPPVDLQAGPPRGVGMLVTGNASGNIFGESSMTPNHLCTNCAGVYMDHAHGNLIRGNTFHLLYAPNSLAGIVVRHGRRNKIGGDGFHEDNLFKGYRFHGVTPPTTNPDAGGILLVGGAENTVQNNRIQNVSGQGILLADTSANRIGGTRQLNGNFIHQNEYNGIGIRGNGSTNNVIQHNRLIQNRADGIDIAEGASYNLIGGKDTVTVGNNTFRLSAPNIIRSNSLHGVNVSGDGTLGNSIRFNSIYTNIGLGISNENSGNEALPPPTNASYGVGSVKGDVLNVLAVPPGSLVDVYSDTTSEGQVFLGKTTVRNDATWAVDVLPPIPFKNITATVTHAVTGSTSEFVVAGADRSFNLVRADGKAPGQQSITLTDVEIPVLVLEASATGDRVRVYACTLEARGTLLDDTQITGLRIYRDNDRDGQITEADGLMTGPFTFSENDGQVTITLSGVIIEPDSPQQWIITYEVSPGVQQGATFSLRIAGPGAVRAEFVFPIGIVAIPIGPFPVTSDEFTVGPSS